MLSLRLITFHDFFIFSRQKSKNIYILEFIMSFYRDFIKRIADLFVSIIALIVLSPLLVIVTIWLYLANNGASAILIQERPGKNNKIFKLIKFKTMTDERDSNGKLLPDEKRLTKVGKFIRSLSIDELLQFINILKGDMSLVGPRPLRTYYLPLYSEIQLQRHNVKPGITGWAQVNGRNAISWKKKFELDVWYVNQLSFLLDMKIILMTLRKVLKREGISSSNNITMEAFNGHN